MIAVLTMLDSVVKAIKHQCQSQMAKNTPRYIYKKQGIPISLAGNHFISPWESHFNVYKSTSTPELLSDQGCKTIVLFSAFDYCFFFSIFVNIRDF